MAVSRHSVVVCGRAVIAFLNRILGLPAGVYLVVVIKSGTGADGVVAWSVTEGKLEGYDLETSGGDAGGSVLP